MDIKKELLTVFAIIDSKEEGILDNNKKGWYRGLGGECQDKKDAIKTKIDGKQNLISNT